MKKIRPDARWNGLSPEQKQVLDKWLFEENLSYAKALPRAQAELGFKGEVSSLKRYYQRREKEKAVEKFTDLNNGVEAVNGAPGETKAIRNASFKVVGGFLFQQMQESPEKAKELASLAQLMVQNEHNEVQRESKAEEHAIRRETLAFAKEKFQCTTMERALKALPQLLDLAEARRDPRRKEYEENRHCNRVRLAMFGPGRGVYPESAEEEAEMAAIKREREARRERETQLEREQEKVSEVQPPPPSSPYYREYIEQVTKWEEENWRPGAEYEI